MAAVRDVEAFEYIRTRLLATTMAVCCTCMCYDYEYDYDLLGTNLEFFLLK